MMVEQVELTLNPTSHPMPLYYPQKQERRFEFGGEEVFKMCNCAF